MALFVYYHPLAMDRTYMARLIEPREFQYKRDFLGKRGDKQDLVITIWPVQFVAEDYSAIDFKYANENRREFLSELEEHYYRDILVFQHILCQTQAPVPDDVLVSDYELEPLDALQFEPGRFVRISRVKHPQPKPPEAPVKQAEAVEHWRQILKARPGDPKAHQGLADNLSDAGDLSEAIRQYRKAVELDPQDADPLNSLGTALLKAGKADEAIKCFREALRTDPRLDKAHNNWGNALAGQGRLKEAVQQYRQALQINPGNSRAKDNLRIVLQLLSKPSP